MTLKTLNVSQFEWSNFSETGYFVTNIILGTLFEMKYSNIMDTSK